MSGLPLAPGATLSRTLDVTLASRLTDGEPECGRRRYAVTKMCVFVIIAAEPGVNEIGATAWRRCGCQLVVGVSALTASRALSIHDASHANSGCRRASVGRAKRISP